MLEAEYILRILHHIHRQVFAQNYQTTGNSITLLLIIQLHTFIDTGEQFTQTFTSTFFDNMNVKFGRINLILDIFI